MIDINYNQEKRDVSEILLKRIEIREACKDDHRLRAKVLLRCLEDDLFWFDMFAWTYDPRKKPSEVPLILYEGKQIEYLQFLGGLLRNPRDAFVDKPRDVGVSVITANFLLKQWLFGDGFNARIGSRKAELVDKRGDLDTLFSKLDFTLDRLPKWMLPRGYDADTDRNHLILKRPDNTNTITGESANPSFARGGRQTMVVFDEIGFWQFARAAWQSAGDVANIRLAVTTPPETGKSSFAYKLRSGQSGEVEIFEFNYEDIPHKDEQWLIDQKSRRSDEEFEREVMKSYQGTVEGKVYLTEWNLHVKVDDSIDYDARFPLYVSWDFGLDTVAMIWLQKDFSTDKVWVIDAYSNTNKYIDFYVPFVTGQVMSSKYDYSLSELTKIKLHNSWKSTITHYGDPSGYNRNVAQENTAVADTLREFGIQLQITPRGGRPYREFRWKTIKLLRRLSVNKYRTGDFQDAIMGATFPKRSESSQATSVIQNPVHDTTSHYRTALEYFADNELFRNTNEAIKKEAVKFNKKYRM